MNTILFSFAVLFSLYSLVKSQPANERTIFNPCVVVVGLFALCYLIPNLVLLVAADISKSSKYAENVELLSGYGFIFITVFTLSYKLPKRFFYLKRFNATSLNIPWTPKHCFCLFAIVFLIIRIILFSYGVGGGGDYIDQYVVRASIPTAVAQILNVSQSIAWMLLCLLLVSTFTASTRKSSFRFVLFALMLFVGDMLITNSRSQLVSFVLLFIAVRMLYARPLGLKKEILFTTLFIVAMGLFAFRRVTSTAATGINFLDVLVPSEFLVIHLNALHLMSIHGTPEFVSPPGISYFQSLFSFIPQQFFVGKWDLASWYVQTYFPEYADAGGGLAFGIIPEALVNWGMISVVFQAFIVAIMLRFAFLSAYKNKYSGSNFFLLYFLFTYSQIYNLLRNNSFVIISGMFYGFLLPYSLLFFIDRVIYASARRRTHP